MSWNDLIGRRLDRYVIVDELGRGGSSRVYRAHDTAAEQDVAIKVIPNDAEDRVGFVRRFDREVEVVKQLSHPNIVAVSDRGETDDLVYLVMQLVGGGTLRARMGKPLPVGEACAAVVQMAHALHHAHVRGIVHRDVKPSNMLINAEDPRHLLLTDFGIAKIQGHRGLTKSGTTVGTPEYMSPEQAEGKETDPRSDVYSLGCVLYEELAGRPPFVGATPVSVLYQQVHARPSYLRSFNSDAPRQLGRIVEQALAKRPEERFGTALHFAEALLQFAEGHLPPIELPEEPGVYVAPVVTRVSSPNLGEGWGGPSVTGALGGLGDEGLDALFPEDAPAAEEETAIPDAGPPDAPSLDVASQPLAPESPLARSKHTIPLNQFRLPARPTRPLELPLTAEGKLDIEALMARVASEADARVQPLQPPLQQPPSPWDSPLRTGPTAPYVRATSEALGEAPSRTSGDLPNHDIDRFPTVETAPVSRPRPVPTYGPQSRPQPIWRPSDDEIIPIRRRPRRGLPLPGGRVIAGAAAAVFLIASLGVWLAVSASALGSLAGPGGHRSATVAVLATPSPSPTPSPTQTASPTANATPTTDPQKALDQQAAAAFRAITLSSPTYDASCASSGTHFPAGQSVYANLCRSGVGPDGPISVAIRQRGQVLYVIANSIYVAKYDWRTQTHSLPVGSYDMLVTMGINGKTATAADIQFTVG